MGERALLRLAKWRMDKVSIRPLTKLLRVSNWPFALKMAFCPALAMAALVGLGLNGILVTAEQAALIDAVVQHDLSTAVGLTDSATRLQQINSSLYRLSTLQASRRPT
jgi:hypothetical protein